MIEPNIEKLAELAETIDIITHSIQLKMPAEFHLNQIKKLLPEWRDSLREIYIDESGENPWKESEE